MSDQPPDSTALAPKPATDSQESFRSVPKLTARQAAFVEQYLIDKCGREAAIRAGYDPATAGTQASALMRDPHVYAALERAMALRSARVNVTQDAVLSEMSLLANSDVNHYWVDEATGKIHLTEDAPHGALRAISSVKRRKFVREDKETGDVHIRYEVEIRLWDKPAPLKLMGRHVGLFPNRVEVTGKGGAPIEFAAMTKEQLQDEARALAEVVDSLEEE